ncbi:MAG TPA: hypothetical protein VH062_12775 [Polyangiaceae bacterium]|nr:hypothetical protein [Polyangiaceae bacterium]
MKDEQGVGLYRERGVGAALVVVELYFEYVSGELLDNGADLTAQQAVTGYVDEQSDDAENVYRLRGHHDRGSENVAARKTRKIFTRQDGKRNAS